eukprot:TRINITY_DN50107_c0_g1_i1.p1 TRINITY_DN50107_c0_g1~~TRINITY_DN50107_c0_g1_i1.p1  ORF type:complete len:822 (+),score=245.25 TRINITY_DN50107_c0_g1_i1:98-2563(+)
MPSAVEVGRTTCKSAAGELPSIYEPGQRVRAPGVSVALHCTDVGLVEDYSEQVGMVDSVLRCDPLQKAEQQIDWALTAARSGRWYVVCNPGSLPTETLRGLAQRVLALPAHEVSEKFILWIVCREEALQRLPQLLRSFLITLAPPLLSNIRARLLASAVEGDNLFLIRQRREDASFLNPGDRVELAARCRSEAGMLALLGGEEDEAAAEGTAVDTAALVAAVRENGERILDIVIAKDWLQAAARVRDIGGHSDVLDVELLSRPQFQPMLEVLLARGNFPFSAASCVHRMALDGNHQILRMLFGARVDRDFNYDSYPLVQAAYSGCEEAAQIVVDRMECVGLHPYRDPRISLHILLGMLSPSPDELPELFRESSAPVALTPAAMQIASRCAACVLEDGAPPYHIPPEAVAHLAVLCSDAEEAAEKGALGNCGEAAAAAGAQAAAPRLRELLRQVLTVADVSRSPDRLVWFYVDFAPDLKEALECMSCYMELLAEGSSPDQRRAETLRELMLRGTSHLPLFECALSYTGTDVRLWGKDGRMRTPLMQCFELPGWPEACNAVLLRDKDPSARNEVGLNCLQQCVVDLTQDPLPYVRHISNYARLFASAVAAGVETTVEPPDFATTLFGLCARAELAPLCYELLSPGPRLNLILASSENMLANLVSYRRQVQVAARPPGADAFALDSRQERCRPQDKFDLPRSLVPLSDEALCGVMGFLNRRDLALGIGLTCARFYFLSLRDELWVALQRAWELEQGAKRGQRFVRSAMCSAKLHHRMHATGTPMRRWVTTTDPQERYECILTGEQVTTRPYGEYIVSRSVAELA